MDVKAISELFKQKLKEENKSIYTIIAYEKDIEQFLHFCVKNIGKSIEDIDGQDVLKFIEHLKENGYTTKSISRKLNSIRTFCRFAVERKIIRQNPATNVPHPKIENKLPRVLSTQEYRALRDVCREDKRLYSIVELLLQTGLKIGELCRLHLSDIIYDNNGKPIALKIRKYESTPEREVNLNEAAANAILTYLEVRPKVDREELFLTRRGKPVLIRNIRFYLEKAFKKAGIEGATVNDLRNTFIAHQLARGASIILISKMVGHKRISTTERYANLLGININKPSKLEVL